MTKRNHESIELVFYKYIGVLCFKKIVLKCEEVFHIKHGYRLMNYHPETTTVEGINNFFWYLIYNCMLHITSILLTLLYYLIAYLGDIRVAPLDWIAFVMVIFNLYCIFLQRYTYLKMKQLLEKINNMIARQYELNIAKIDAMSTIYVSEVTYEKTVKLIDRVEGVFTRKSSCYITEGDICLLEQMENALCGIDMNIRSVTLGEMSNELSIDGGIKFYNPCKRVNVIVGGLKYILNRKIYLEDKKNIVLVTASDKCEDLYKTVFGDGSTEIELLRLKLLRYIYMNKVQVE